MGLWSRRGRLERELPVRGSNDDDNKIKGFALEDTPVVRMGPLCNCILSRLVDDPMLCVLFIYFLVIFLRSQACAPFSAFGE